MRTPVIRAALKNSIPAARSEYDRTVDVICKLENIAAQAELRSAVSAYAENGTEPKFRFLASAIAFAQLRRDLDKQKQENAAAGTRGIPNPV